VVLDGVVDLEVGGHPVTLQAGDTLVATDATVGRSATRRRSPPNCCGWCTDVGPTTCVTRYREAWLHERIAPRP
jgi:hypothetical protein